VTPQPVVGIGRLSFIVPRAGSVRVELFDVRGRRAAALLDSPAMPSGTHEIGIPADLGAGVYYYRILAAGRTSTGRFVVMR
jgi:hypothetical protein